MAGAVTACLLLAGCASGGTPATTAVRTPVPVLRVSHVRQAMPDAAALPGWDNVVKPTADADRFLCQNLFTDECDDLVALGQSEFTRGRRTPQEWVRLSFTLYSFRSERAAHDLYAALDLGGTGLTLSGSVGDEHEVTRRKVGEATTLSIKARTGNTVLWVFALGSKQTATSERAEEALRLMDERTRQAKSGVRPTAGASIS
ncbi:hypothetical protein ACF090_16790 [Streptomyces sp. NPDC014892]|uniref:hypothetical protein n=1 Tax=Streptomyces TaxID=1883 RepID=UPI001EFB5BD2|nr:hypothetical protein [Streptomyces deccanensis]ULR49417.1 hypothetical protein L3078_09025 [Streptomyces deccanensis]